MSFKIESQEQKNMDVGTLNIPAFLIVQQIGKPSLLKALLNKDRLETSKHIPTSLSRLSKGTVKISPELTENKF